MNLQNIIAGLMAFIASFVGLFHSPQTVTFKDVAQDLNPLSIVAMRTRSYPGSNITIEQTLAPALTYNRYIASYNSDGFKIYALLYVPKATKPKDGFPVIVFNHGYITPEKYTPDGNYIAYTDVFAKNGYIVFKPDYRGNGKSEGTSTSTYFSPDYTIDDLNAISSIKKYSDANSNAIGVWGHSMGGNITLRDLVINKTDVKAAVIWTGVVGSIDEIMNNWQNRVSYKPDGEDLRLRGQNKDVLIGIYGTPNENPDFWRSIDPTNFVKDINTPIQIHVGLDDNQVPPDFSSSLYTKLKNENKNVEFYEYPGADHNISQGFSIAIQRSINFFDHYLK